MTKQEKLIQMVDQVLDQMPPMVLLAVRPFLHQYRPQLEALTEDQINEICLKIYDVVDQIYTAEG